MINLVRLRGELVTPDRQIDVCRDPKDSCFLEASVKGNADVIVSGDADFLDLKDFVAIPILGVVEFLAQL